MTAVPPDVKISIARSVTDTLKRCLLYEPNVRATWARAEQAVDYELSKFSEYVAFHEITVDGTFYGDRLAQEAASYEEYRIRCAAATGKEPDVSEKEFEIRRNVRDDHSIYVSVKALYAGEDSYQPVVVGTVHA